MTFLHHHTRTKLRERSLIALTIVCIPCICVIGTCVILSHCFAAFSTYERRSTRRKRQVEYEERERRRLTPWVLAPRLERDVDSLTICSDDEGFDFREVENESEFDEEEEGKGKGKGGRTHWQDQSLFFRLLPLEIRQQVYEECIGGYTLHISTLDAYRRISHSRCKTTPSPGSCPCTFLSRQPGVADEWGNTSLLHLLGTCRRM
jgi:hypothetical protein